MPVKEFKQEAQLLLW